MVFDEVVSTRFHDLRPQEFAPVTVRTKGVAYPGYLYQGDFADTAPPIPAIAAGI